MQADEEAMTMGSLALDPSLLDELTDVEAELLRAAVEGVDDGVSVSVPVIRDGAVVDLRWLFFNASYHRQNPTAVAGRLASSTSVMLPRVLAAAQEAWEGGGASTFTLRPDPGDGAIPWMRLDGSFQRVGNLLLEFDHDLSGEERLAVRHAEVLDLLGDAVLVWHRREDGGFEVVYANAAARPWIPSAYPVDLADTSIAPEQQAAQRRSLEAAIATMTAQTFTVRLHNRVDPDRPHAVRVTNTPLVDGDGVTTVVVDLSVEMIHAAELRERARRDPDTGLLNRTGFVLEVAGLIEQHEGLVSVVGIELDQLEMLERTAGLGAQLEIVAVMTDRIRAALGDEVVIGRLSSSKLAVAVAEPGAIHDVEHLVAELVESLSRPVSVGGPGMHIDISAGIAAAPLHGTDAAELVSRARLATLEARNVGTPVVVWRPGLEARTVERGELLAEIERGLAADEFTVVFQPKIDRRRCFAGAEALARWKHPQLGAIPTSTFIDVLEQSTLARRFTVAIATMALSQWRQSGLPGRVAVNLPAALASDPKLVELVEGVLADTGCPAHLLEIEITERGLVASDRLAAANFQALKRLGVRISIDDFGTGNASLSYLRTLHPDEVKIDRWFISNVDTDPVNGAVVKAVVGMALALGLEVVAEGVESAAELDTAWRLGCDLVQGFGVATPHPIGHWPDLVAADGRFLG